MLRYICAAAVLLMALSGAALAGEPSGFIFGRDRALYSVAPKKPVKVKLKLGTDGKYTWELTGDDVESIIEADRKLREHYKTDGKK